LCRYFTDNDAWLVTSYIVQRKMKVAVFFNFEFNNAARKRKPFVLNPSAF